METFTIGKLAKSTGVGVETIRYYEREGLIQRPKLLTGTGYRKYDAGIARRLLFIRRAKELGFSLTEIKELLSLRATTKAKCGAVKLKAKSKIADIEAKLSDLQAIKSTLERLVVTCNAEASTSECPILDALDQHNLEKDA